MKLTPISADLRNAVYFSLALQIPILLLAASTPDFGEAIQICYFGFLAFSAFLFMVLLRRRSAPTRVDLFIIRAGFIPTIIGTYFLAYWIWKARGF